jgi:hypothetical protein
MTACAVKAQRAKEIASFAPAKNRHVLKVFLMGVRGWPL